MAHLRAGVLRRGFLLGGISAMGVIALPRDTLAASQDPQEAAVLQSEFDRKLTDLLGKPNQFKWLRKFRERQVLLSPFAFGPERAPIRAAPSKTAISARATSLIVACEVTSKAKYIKSYQRPTWPKGESGVTIGVGYDVGYVTAAWLKDDWGGYASDQQIQALAVACDATGERAHRLIGTLQNVVIDWDTAYKQFLEKVQPRWVGETEQALPNTSMLAADSLGALVSLVYNRGPSFSNKPDPQRDPIDRYREMRAIKDHMEAKEFEKIPAELRSMCRIWRGNPDMRGLLDRRELEAVLFEAGLKSQRTS